MAIVFVLTGGGATGASALLETFCERELATPVHRGLEAGKFLVLTCDVVRETAPRAFLLDRAYGESKIAELLIEIGKATAPGDSVSLSVQGEDDVDLRTAKSSPVYSAISIGAKSNRASEKSRAEP